MYCRCFKEIPQDVHFRSTVNQQFNSNSGVLADPIQDIPVSSCFPQDWEGGQSHMNVQVYLVDMVSEAPMGAEARLNGSSTIAPIKNYKRLYWTSICPVSVKFV